MSLFPASTQSQIFSTPLPITESMNSSMQLQRDTFKREMEDEANGGDEGILTHKRLGSDLNYTNSNLGSEMMKMMLKEEREEMEERRRKGMWVEEDEESSIFYGDFPSLPEIPCLSSSSTSSSLSKCSSSSSSSYSASSSSTGSWAVVKAEIEGGVVENRQNLQDPGIEMAIKALDQPMGSIDVLEELGGMELLDSSSIWDPSFLFPCDTDDEEQHQNHQEQEHKQEELPSGDGEEKQSEDLAMIFFDWLKSNKESISPEDLRSIKLKRSTIECAASRLGGGKEGMMQLLKLILAWVQNHHLQRRKREEDMQSITFSFPFHQQQNPFPVQVPISNSVFQTPNRDLNQWGPHSSFDPTFVQPPPPPSPSMVGYVGDGVFASGNNHLPLHPYSPPPDYHMFGSSSSWSSHLSHYNTTFSNPPSPPFLGFSNNYSSGGVQVHGVGEPLVKMAPSATKEARKKRMARQRRFYYHHHRHQNHHQQHHLSASPHCSTASQQADSGKWVMWSSVGTPSSSSSQTLLSPDALSLRRDAMQPQQPRQFISDRRQGWKPEKNLRFLLQKVLKQSDVGNLGRIVLPKKEAETHLPELEARDGIPIAMEDIVTSRVWNMRYRFWPNNKSRMYLLENTADFVRSNGLQEGDFIVLYSDTKCGKYMIRGVKVRNAESKPETRSPGKMQRNLSLASSSSAPDDSSPPSILQTNPA